MHDVAIVGAGPVGTFLAAVLIDAGLDAVAVDARTGTSGSSRAIGIHPPSLRLLDAIGVASQIRDSGVQISRGVARSGGVLLAELRLTEPGAPPIVSVPQPVTQSILDAAVQSRRPDGIRRGIRVEAVHRTQAGFVLTGKERGSHWETQARFVVGADGASGSMRSLLHTAGRRVRYPDRYLMGDFRDDTGDGSLAVLHLERGGIVESFPLPGGVRRWVVHEGASRLVDGPAALADLIEGRTGCRPDPGSSSMFSSFVPHRAIAFGMVGNGLALVGDAAHELSPIGGQGMNLGWADAAELGRVLPRFLTPGSDRRELEEFGRRRLAVARRAARQAELNMLLGRPAPAVLQPVRALLAKAIAHQPVGRKVARVFTMATL
ncbi:FAD-dependent oxidoreductase [Mycetocola sp.]|uniref:FAD-dependent oxidoreductase n=1 Tax=Mycetocola sp. TaxID=1871042 RepID=UPI003988B8B3